MGSVGLENEARCYRPSSNLTCTGRADEPNLMFTLAGTSQRVTTLDVYFDAESRPPNGSNDDEGLGHRVRLTMPQAEIAAAVSDWEQDLREFPPR